MTKIEIEVKDLKILRESLCVASGAIGYAYGDQRDYAAGHISRIEKLIEQIDEIRPLGVDGSHGDLHTPECGCLDVRQ